MSERSDYLLIADILSSIEKIQEYLDGFTMDQFFSDNKTQDAISRNFEIIGEATARLSPGFKKKYTQINWRVVKDFRNKLIHDYFGVDFSTVWIISKEELPVLKEKIKSLIQEINQSVTE
jgi:uncharacterized protein with HEPN domain